jgi:hypothetical protein
LGNSLHDCNDSPNGGATVTAKKPTPTPPPGFSAFKKLLGKIVKVPKSEIEEKEEEYMDERQRQKKARAIP